MPHDSRSRERDEIGKSKEETAETRGRIVESAAAEFRRNGIHGTDLDDFMAAAGLTRGGFYCHFESKDHVVKVACAFAFDTKLACMQTAILQSDKGEGVWAAAEEHLSTFQRDNPANSCPLAVLGSELARSDEATRKVATAAFFAESLEGNSSKEKRRRALAAVSDLIGALTIARVVPDRPLSDEILKELKLAVANCYERDALPSPRRGRRRRPVAGV